MKTANTLWRDLLRQVRLLPLAALLTALPLTAQVPSLINYQGRLTDAQGQPVTGNRTMAVRIYDAASGGNMTYEESIGTVAVGNGTYSFQFGASGNGVVTVLSGQDYLALSVNGTEESTRTRLLAVPFALVSQSSLHTQFSWDSWDTQVLANYVADLELKLFESQSLTPPEGMVTVAKKINSNGLSSFFIDQTEVTYLKWQEVRDWAIQNGYNDLANAGSGVGGNHPVHSVTWFEVLKWCNARSEMENLEPIYYSGESVFRSGTLAKADFVEKFPASGYRLPNSNEWEWAATGGVRGIGNHTFSGGNDANQVAWYSVNSSNATQVVGTKLPNELGLQDMSGNVREWCGDSYADFETYKEHPFCRGGGWESPSEKCAIAYEDWADRFTRYDDLGFRTIRRVVTSVEAAGQFSVWPAPVRPTPSPFDGW